MPNSSIPQIYDGTLQLLLRDQAARFDPQHPENMVAGAQRLGDGKFVFATKLARKGILDIKLAVPRFGQATTISHQRSPGLQDLRPTQHGQQKPD